MHDATGDLESTDGPPPAFDRCEVSRLLLAGLRSAGYTTAPVSSLLATYPAVRTVWSE
jgi:hypothetical protein